jgi:hypothetical protein
MIATGGSSARGASNSGSLTMLGLGCAGDWRRFVHCLVPMSNSPLIQPLNCSSLPKKALRSTSPLIPGMRPVVVNCQKAQSRSS